MDKKERHRYLFDHNPRGSRSRDKTPSNRQAGGSRHPTGISAVVYSEHRYSEKTAASLEEYLEAYKKEREQGTVTWMHLTGFRDPESLKKLGEIFKLHPLSLEAALKTGQRPKWERSGDYDFMILYRVSEKEILDSQQVAVFLGEDFLITLTDTGDDIFGPIREKLQQGLGTIRKRGSDYLCYCICDLLIDSFSPLLESLGERIEVLEDSLIVNPTRHSLGEIHRLKRELLLLARVIWAEREVINAMLREESSIIKQDTLRYLRDSYDRTVQYIDIIEIYRDMVGGMIDAYLSSISNQTNIVMKTLTIIATIFIPLSFIVGVYGMNFRYMPELEYRYGYFVVWGVMLTITAGMLAIFRRKNWI